MQPAMVIEVQAPGPEIRRRFLHWASRQPLCVFLDSCGTDIDRHGTYEWIAAVARTEFGARIQSLPALRSAMDAQPFGWLFGAFSYDLKNTLEPKLHTQGPARLETPELDFFRPEIVVAQVKGSKDWVFECGFSVALWQEILAEQPKGTSIDGYEGFRSNFSRETYLAAIDQIRELIAAGDSYELNLAQHFVAEGRISNPVAFWEELIGVSPSPFAGFARWGERFLLSASPERFLRLRSGMLMTQPIKGTIARNPDPALDSKAAAELRNNPKEQAENVMIVDLSRNDLHRVCETGSVGVPNLFEIQSFPQVHHLVSTISGRKRLDVHPLEAFCTAFPPGSMTGAPKIRTCELIDEIERSARGLYAGSLGYFAPGGDFDFNVIIRSLVHDRAAGLLSYHVGGAITWDSESNAEYEETLVKARGIAQVMSRRA